MQQIGWPPERKRIPVVLTVQQEVQSVLDLMAGTEALLSALLPGRVLRLREALGLRVKDVDLRRLSFVSHLSQPGTTPRPASPLDALALPA